MVPQKSGGQKNAKLHKEGHKWITELTALGDFASPAQVKTLKDSYNDQGTEIEAEATEEEKNPKVHFFSSRLLMSPFVIPPPFFYGESKTTWGRKCDKDDSEFWKKFFFSA